LEEHTSPSISRARLFGAGAAALAAAGLAACGGNPEDPDESGEGFETSSRTPTSERTVAQPDPVVTKEFGPGDLGIAKYALTLEYVEEDLYSELVDSGLFEGDELALLQDVSKNETAHVRALERFIEGSDSELPERPKTAFDVKDRKQALGLATDIEDVGAGAYLGQVTRIVRADVLSLALSIHTAEGAHAAALAELSGRSIVPDGAIASPLTAQEVLVAVEPYLAGDEKEKAGGKEGA
jgi:hypothetical protein